MFTGVVDLFARCNTAQSGLASFAEHMNIDLPRAQEKRKKKPTCRGRPFQISPRQFYSTTLVSECELVADVMLSLIDSFPFAIWFSLCLVSFWWLFAHKL